MTGTMGLNKPKVLLIDDDQSTRITLSMALKHLGYHVELAVDGLEGLRKIGESIYDWVISDIRMPNMSGDELIEKLEGVYPKKQVILISAHEAYDSKNETMMEIAAFLEKPVKISDLLHVFKDRMI
jgi:DNA-binding NtrC family response regulator